MLLGGSSSWMMRRNGLATNEQPICVIVSMSVSFFLEERVLSLIYTTRRYPASSDLLLFL